METEIKAIQESTIEEFAQRHGLVMEMNERPSIGYYKNLDRWYCRFKSAELQSEDGYFLYGVTGNANTQEDAILDYAKQISEGTLVIDSYKETRREIKVPRLFPLP